MQTRARGKRTINYAILADKVQIPTATLRTAQTNGNRRNKAKSRRTQRQTGSRERQKRRRSRRRRQKARTDVSKIVKNFNIDELRVATLNVNGKLQQERGRKELQLEMEKHKIDIAAFQETHAEEGKHHFRGQGMMHLVDKGNHRVPQKRYGLGFYISARMEESFQGITRVSDRISTAKFTLLKGGDTKRRKKEQDLYLINVYAPTNTITLSYREAGERTTGDMGERPAEHESSLLTSMTPYELR